MDLKCNYI